MKPKWIPTVLTTALTVALFASPASAQLASPQWSRPAMDSTHVTGTAQRVMPEIPITPPSVDKRPDRSQAPRTIPELLAAFDGVVLDMPGNEKQGAFEQMRFVFTPEKMQVQFTALWEWYDSCAATATSPRCVHGVFDIFLSPEGMSVIRKGCGSGLGTAGGSAEFKWTDFSAFDGQNATSKRWLLQRDSFWSSCYQDSGSSS